MSESMRGITRLLRAVRLVWCLSATLTGVAVVAGVMSAFLLFTVALDNLLLLPTSARWVCLGVGAVLAGIALGRGLIWRLPIFAGHERLAVYFEQRVPDADNHLINAVQLAALAEEGTRSGGTYSEEMATQYMVDAAGALGGFSGWEAFDKDRLRKYLKRAIGPVLALALYAVLLSSPFHGGVYRLLHPASTMNTASGLRIRVTPGDVTVVEGGDLEVRAQVSGGDAESVLLEYQPQADPEALRASMQALPGASTPNSEYVIVMADITVPRTYRVVAQPGKQEHAVLAIHGLTNRPAVSQTFHVQTVPPPRIESLRLAYEFPDYIGRADQVDEAADGDINAPVGTRVRIRAQCNKALAEAALRIGEDETAAQVEGRQVDASITVEASGSYCFLLTDEEGFQNVDPIVHTLVAVPDRAPKVAITAPDRDVTIGSSAEADAVLPVVFEAEDDYGLTKIELCVKHGDANDRKRGLYQASARPRGRDSETGLSPFSEAQAPPCAQYKKATEIDLAHIEAKPGELIQIWIEATDNKPDKPNRTRSRTLNVRIRVEAAEDDEAGAEEGEEEDLGSDEETAMALEEEPGEPVADDAARDQVEDKLTEFMDMQREIIDQTNNLSAKESEDLTGEEKDAFKDVAAAEDDVSKFLEELVSDLSKLPKQDFTKPTLADEVIEILAEVEMAEDALELENKLMAVTAEQVGLELAEELIHDLPSWLSDVPDKLKWELEEPPEEYEVPMAELPEELTDLMGELIDEEAAMTEEVEDVSSSWADSIDAGAGWATMDGPISNMSAKGKTGNLLPNSSEIGGRSGEGRTGRAHGEFVEKTAVGKGGRDTPTRLTADPLEAGIVEDSSEEARGGATGGGKLSGAGGAGLPGPVPPELMHTLGRLAGRQADIRAKAQRLDFKLKVVNIPAPGLEAAINTMQEFEEDLRDFRYQNVLERKDVVLNQMRESHENMGRQVKVRGERKSALPRETQEEIIEALDEEVLPEYRDMVADYFRALAEAR